jgi:hypothetical protein
MSFTTSKMNNSNAKPGQRETRGQSEPRGMRGQRETRGQSEPRGMRGQSEQRGTRLPRAPRDEYKSRSGDGMSLLEKTGLGKANETATGESNAPFIVRHHGPGTRTFPIAETYGKIIFKETGLSTKVVRNEISFSGSISDWKSIHAALIAAYGARKETFNETGNHSKAVFAGNKIFKEYLNARFPKEDTKATPVKKTTSNTAAKNKFSVLLDEETVKVQETATEPIHEPVKVSKSKKQLKNEARKAAAEFQFGPALTLGGF